MKREHIGGSDCWCKPRHELPCVICLGDKRGCSACDRGWREVSREEFDASELNGLCICCDVEVYDVFKEDEK